jgi:hypothetical protein
MEAEIEYETGSAQHRLVIRASGGGERIARLGLSRRSSPR